MIGKIARRLGLGLVWLVILLCLAVTLIPPFLDRVYYRGAAGDHFDGAHFFNPGKDDTFRPPTGRSRGSFFWRMLTRAENERATWPDTVPITPSKPAARVDGDAMVATWVGHAGFLVQTQGLNILTDPIWSDVAGRFGIGPRRVTEPGIRFDDLPKVDVVVISHNHYDHMDIDTLKRIWERDKPLIVSSLGNDSILKANGIAAKALDWGGRMTVKPGVDVVVNRNHHWSSRFGVDRNRALWSSFVVTLPGGNLFFAGDTGFGDGNWPVEARKLGPVRLALIPIGAFRFAPGMMDTGSHMGPHQAVEVFRKLGATRALGMHWGTFQLSNEARDTPPAMLAEVMACHGLDPALFSTRTAGVPVSIAALAAQPAGKTPDDACLMGPKITGLK